MRRVEPVFCLHDGSVDSRFMIVVAVSSHTVSCSQGGSTHLGVGVIAITSLCTSASSMMQELVACSTSEDEQRHMLELVYHTDSDLAYTTYR